MKGWSRILLLLLLARPVSGADYQDSERIAPESAQESAVGLERLDPWWLLGPQRHVFEDALANAPPYWRDTRGSFKIRTFDFRRADGDMDTRDALAAGFELGILSGKWREAFSFEISWSTSYGIRAPDDRGNTGILRPDQGDISVISRAFGQWNFSEASRVRLFRQDFNMPYINRQDSRMIPTTHEAYMFEHLGKRLTGAAGYVAKVKKRDSDEFVPMGEQAGVPGNDNGTSVLGLQYDWLSGWRIGAVAQHTQDFFVTVYSETSYNKTISEDWGLQLTAQLSNQKSTGEELVGDFNTYMWGARGRISYRGAVLTLATTQAGDAIVRSPFGGQPHYTQPMIGDFDHAQETALRIGLSQNLGPRGLPGLSITVNYTEGQNAQLNDGTPVPDSKELDVTADYRPESGVLKGAWFRLRWGRWDRGPGLPEREDLRFIINYTLSAFD